MSRADDACSYCLEGAINWTAVKQPLIGKTFAFLERLLFGDTCASFNDSVASKRDVLALLDRAIERAGKGKS